MRRWTRERSSARTIIDHCAHPAYRDYLHRYLQDSRLGHISQNPKYCFDLHRNLMAHGSMLPAGEP